MTDITSWVWDRVGEDTKLGDEAKYLVLAALEGDEALEELTGLRTRPERPAGTGDLAEPTGAFLKQVKVRGFRGIGSEAKLDLLPRPGLTIISGRNGSGKSSFAEALEVALTGTTYRWQSKRSKQWQASWRNIHDGSQPRIEVALAEEAVGQTRVTVEWHGEALEDSATWLQRHGEKKEAGIASLGWAGPMEMYRPLLSYDELGALFSSEPSKLYDAVATVLGLEQVADAIRRLDARAKALAAPGAEVTRTKGLVQGELDGLTDERALRAQQLLSARSLDLGSLRDLATGVSAEDSSVGTLRALANLATPSREQVEAAASSLRSAVQAMAEAGDTAAAALERRTSLKAQALEVHAHDGDMPCPVCAGGTLDAEWATAARADVEANRSHLAKLTAARSALTSARAAAKACVTHPPAPLEGPANEDVATEVDAVRAAWSAWAAAPGDDLALADHLLSTWPPLANTLAKLRSAAVAAVARRDDAWAPVAGRLAALADRAEAWEKQRPLADQAKAALKWLKDNDIALKNERVKPIADQAAAIWADLRQESNVEMAGLSLEGAATRRHVSIAASVDGEEAGALAVMSQGELHALALALFLPRATMSESPFRFVVLDDPVQAMDPAKVDGLVTVLSKIAQDRQVLVFSHDDRLASAVRRAAVDAQIFDVTRRDGSQVSIENTFDPPKRYLRDARALVKDENLPEETLRRTLPGLLRMALEAAARDRFMARELAAGAKHAEVEDRWQAATTTSKRMWLAVRHDGQPSEPWLAKGAHRKRALGICTSAMHQGLSGDPLGACEDVERLVDDVRSGAK